MSVCTTTEERIGCQREIGEKSGIVAGAQSGTNRNVPRCAFGVRHASALRIPVRYLLINTGCRLTYHKAAHVTMRLIRA